jgi:hypothetical protein
MQAPRLGPAFIFARRCDVIVATDKASRLHKVGVAIVSVPGDRPTYAVDDASAGHAQRSADASTHR